MLKKTLLILAIICVLISAALFYVNKILLPVQIKNLVIKAAEEATHRKVTLGGLQYNPLQGLVLLNLTVYNKAVPEKIFLHLDSASAQILFLPLIQKKIILPSVHINNLAVSATRIDASTWNFSDLLGIPQGTKPTTTPPNIIVSALDITNASVILTDLTENAPFSEMITPINIQGSLALNGKVNLAGNILIPSTNGTIIFTSSLSLQDQNIKADIKLSNIITSKYFRFIPASIQIPVKQLDIADLKASLTKNNETLTIAGNILCNNIDALPAAGFRATGSLGISQAILTNDMQGLNFKGAIDLKSAALETSTAQKFSADISTTKTALTLKDNLWTLNTDAAIQGLSALIGPGQMVKADINIAQLTASQTTEELNARSDIMLTNVTIELPDLSIQTSLNAPACSLKQKNGSMDITVHPLFTSLSVASQSGDQKILFSGTPSAALHAVIPAKPEKISYDGTVSFKDGTLKGLPTITEITKINGDVNINTNELLLPEFTFLAMGIPIKLQGSVKEFNNPRLNIKAIAHNIDLAMAAQLIPQIVKDNALTITGTTDITAEVTGPVSALAKDGIKATAALNNIQIESGKLKQSLSNISGLVTYSPPKITWDKLSFGFQNTTYTLNGSLLDLVNPLISTSVKADNINVDILAKKNNDIITIDKINAAWFDSSINIDGKITLIQDAPPIMDITVSGKAVLRDIPKIAPQLTKDMAALKLSGILQVNAHVKGNPLDWQHLDSAYQIETPALTAMGYKIDNITLDATQQNGKLFPLKINGKIYGGNFNVDGNVDLITAGFPLESNFTADNVSLEQLKRDTPLKTQQISGTISLNGDIKGSPANLKSLTGNTEFNIANGSLLDLQMLPAVVSFLYESVRGNNTVITDASANFKIADGRIATNNLTLKNSSISLIGEGWVDMLDQTVDLNITPRLEAPALSSTNAAGILSIINPTQGLVNIHIGGTVSNPKIDKNISAPTVIKKTLTNTVNGFLKLFE